MGRLLWSPSPELVKAANITRYMEFVNEKYGLNIHDYWQLHSWSVDRIAEFWASIWEFTGVKSSRGYDVVVDDLNKFPGARWFPKARLNFAGNLLRYRDDKAAFVFVGENKRREQVTYGQLYDRISSLAQWLRKVGVVPGDRVCAYMPNLIETVIAMLAATSVGAAWAACGSELGTTAVLDRLGQIKPKVLFTSDGYFYGGKAFNTQQNAQTIARQISSLEKVVLVPCITENPDISSSQKTIHYSDTLSAKPQSILDFEQVPFDQPVYIMFSSGTTGKPKCMVQGVGVLLNEMKDVILHADLKRNDRITYITSASWMMWNWLVSSLSAGATIILYDGNPNYPDWGNMWRLIQEERLTIFGCSASYINYLKTKYAKPGDQYDLSSLREISQTGSPLSPEGFEWIYERVKRDLHFNSISGGTDINGVFAGGTPLLPVYAGELSGPYLGMKIAAYDERGNPVIDKEGELVCEAPSPSMPTYFWDDPQYKRYREAYFDFYRATGKNVWRHGDYITIDGVTRGIIFLGRSDSVLKPSGVRIGSGEIYNVIESFKEISDSLVVGQNWREDQRIILFVKMIPSITLTKELKSKIKQALREKASPRHVPAIIMEAPDIPYTYNMKKVESAVRNIINEKPVANTDALINPASLEYFRTILPVLQEGNRS
jgi:acetoacetyl-CoA synthetase